MAQQVKALHLGAKGVTTVPGSNPRLYHIRQVIVSPLGRRTTGPASSGFSRHCKSEFVLDNGPYSGVIIV